jgi:putative two-component system response regulator
MSENVAVLTELLKDAYRTKVALTGEAALKIARSEDPPDLILLDVMMPGMSGYAVCRELKTDAGTRDIPIIFLTALDDDQNESQGLALGAVDYVTKPVRPPILLARVRTHLRLKEANELLRDQNALLEQRVEQRTRHIEMLRDVTMMAMGSLAETRDNETGNHIRRTQSYVRVLAESLRGHPRFVDTLSDDYIDRLYKSAPLHDIGKIGVPDSILLKPGKLSGEEFEIMKRHTTLGYEAIRSAEKALGGNDSFLSIAAEIALSHQEKWDGSGYPEGMSGDDIPVSARLMAVADVYDALICKRIYKPPMTHEAATAIIHKGRGSHFDPDVVDAFNDVAEQFRAIAEEFAD